MRRLIATAASVLLAAPAFAAPWETVGGVPTTSLASKGGTRFSPICDSGSPVAPPVLSIRGRGVVRFYDRGCIADGSCDISIRIYSCPGDTDPECTSADREEVVVERNGDGTIDENDLDTLNGDADGDSGATPPAQRHAIYDFPPGHYLFDLRTDDNSGPATACGTSSPMIRVDVEE